jgi:hypothetical protein
MRDSALGAEIWRPELDTIRSLCDTGFQVIIYGGRDNLPFREASGFTEASAVVILDREAEVEIHRRKIALMTSGAEEDEAFANFVSSFLAQNMARIYELRIINGHHRSAKRPSPAAGGSRKGTNND